MRVYEVFLKRDGKEEFRHAGSLEAPDDEMALLLASEAYARRGEGDQMWLIERSHLLVAETEQLSVNAAKDHRRNDGAAIAAHRRQHKADQ